MNPKNPEIKFCPQQIIDSRFTKEQLPLVGRISCTTPDWKQFDEQRPSAVLCLLTQSSTQQHASIILTKRSTIVRTHKGQIGFPGGRAEDQDKNPVETALRESMEEIGLDPNRVLIHGSLPWIRALDHQLVIPILGSTDVDPIVLQANCEVEDIIPIPWSIFCRDNAETFGFTMFGKRRQSLLYRYDDLRIWGLTAKMLSDADFMVITTNR